ncbi:hypothetical protein [Dyadobacter sp.]|uniref:hypothetical protein n=1 Tax=Dyadobacter sp. TaxID=1914288 RepID=UPI003F6F213A
MAFSVALRGICGIVAECGIKKPRGKIYNDLIHSKLNTLWQIVEAWQEKTYQKIKRMDKKTIKELYECKDRRRQLALFKAYSSWLFMDASLKFIQERINRDLGFNLVTVRDIKYIRHHFKGQLQIVPKSSMAVNVKAPEAIFQERPADVVSWTNPDEVGSNQNILKTKFS